MGTVGGVSGGANVILDAMGYLTSSGLTQLPMLPTPQRLVDTRSTVGGPIASGSPRCFPVAGQGTITADAIGVILNVTGVGYTGDGWLTLYPAGQAVPGTSTLNFDNHEYAIANGAIGRLGTNGKVCVSVGTVGGVSGGANIVLDAIGYLTSIGTGVVSTPADFSPNGDGVKDTTSIGYTLSAPATVSVRLYDWTRTPSLVRLLVNAQPRSAGTNSERWDGKTDANQVAPDATYAVRIDTTDGTGTVAPYLGGTVALDTTPPHTTIASQPAGSTSSTHSI